MIRRLASPLKNIRAPLNVLYIVATGEMGGTQRFIDSVIDHHSEWIRPVVLTFRSGGWLEKLRERGVAAYNIEAARLREPMRCWRAITHIIHSEGIGLVHSADAWCHAVSLGAAIRCRCKHIWFEHGPIGNQRWHGVMPLLPADLILTNSRFMGERIRRSWRGARRIGVVHYGLEWRRWQPDPVRRTQMRNAWGLDESVVAIGITGFIDIWKGQDILLKAAARVRPELTNVRYLVIGGPRPGVVHARCVAFERSLRESCAAQRLDDVVTFTGHLDLQTGALDALDIVVHASTEPEPFGMVVLEAMAKAKAIIASAEGGPCEILRNGQDGLLITPRSPEALASALIELTHDAQMRERLGSRALQSVRSCFSAEIAARELEHWYEAVA
jgi:glycosyltransferase involved in cell wall biosynthesis